MVFQWRKVQIAGIYEECASRRDLKPTSLNYYAWRSLCIFSESGPSVGEVSETFVPVPAKAKDKLDLVHSDLSMLSLCALWEDQAST